MDKQHSQFLGNFTWEISSVWIRLVWTEIFIIFCELGIPREISCLTHQIIVFIKQKVLLAAAVKNWHSWQFSSPCGCKEADGNGNVTMGWAGCSGSVIHSYPALCYLSEYVQGTNTHLHSRDSSLQVLRDLWKLTGFPCPAEHHLPGWVMIPFSELWNSIKSALPAWQKHKQQQRQ